MFYGLRIIAIIAIVIIAIMKKYEKKPEVSSFWFFYGVTYALILKFTF